MTKSVKYQIFKLSKYLISDKLFYKIQHYKIHANRGEKAYWANLKTPATFNEKILWLKNNFRHEIGTTIVDKYRVRQWIKEKIGDKYLIPLIEVYKDPDEIDIAKLPQEFILKPNHGSGMVFICRDKSTFDFDTAKRQLKQWMGRNYYYHGREWQYDGIEPQIVCEKLLSPEKPLKDYKIFCFNGSPKYIQVDLDRFTRHARCYYDLDWNKLPFTILYPKSDKEIEKPIQLEEMLAVAKKLAKDFVFLRVDLYLADDEIYFGEVTFHPEGGNGPFIPSNWDKKLGEELVVPIGKIKR